MPSLLPCGMARSQGFLSVLMGDGRPLLVFTAIVLFLSGVFVIAQSAVGHFLPHDVVHLGMDAEELSAFFGGRVTLFMFHDRVAFGGSIMAVAILYLWLAFFPLRKGERWAWWSFTWSGAVGFGSFLTYLGYGYLDTWHGVATLLLIPFFILGLVKSRSVVDDTLTAGPRIGAWIRSRSSRGRAMLLFVALGLFLGGVVIMGVGMTTVFVPQDLRYMMVQGCGDLESISPRLVPLIAHDRAAFGGGLATIGLLMTMILWHRDVDRALWEALAITLAIGFGSAIGVHFVIGYTDFIHLLPAYFGAAVAALGLLFTRLGFRVQPDL